MSETTVGFFYDYEYDDYSFIVGKAADCETVVNSDGVTVAIVAKKFGVPCMVAFEIICAMYLLGHNIERAKKRLYRINTRFERYKSNRICS